ncbi:unnamed protein product [Effrenium voratum]|nr:unnamed protein product [Effrenium voratum]|mmetsp:Transcript_2800/g.6689  ORF Transcript_2800/g.6689 Transcript_2800/m.6689 type:complete len:423 (+) Transcript_2800:51-1319(+)|eukprot:CAMPEP_0181435222 /NCGR_PEP_ID=MMETSP1110-20121109/20221_1 /TAXON_ID=174948 /ORGANISM="Symbiodinium sp., Strain CCMP421" /LENGTH=422 /DNA_ID=CAMNT_0023558749 /DNA_START=43 /DNA_END=1311 /DNA_ORIENTATION=-
MEIEPCFARGWSMKRGHRKRIEACSWKALHSCSSAWGRSVVKRTVNTVHKAHFWFSNEPRAVQAKQRELGHMILEGLAEFYAEEEEVEDLPELSEPLETENAEHFCTSLILQAKPGDLEVPSRECFSETASDCKANEMCEVSSVCSTTAGTFSCDSSFSSRRTPWETALVRAEVSARQYFALHGEKSKPRVKKVRQSQRPYSVPEKVAEELRQLGAKVTCDRKACAFEQFRWEFLQNHLSQVGPSLRSLYGSWLFRPTPLSAAVQDRFWQAYQTCSDKLTVAYHGTNEAFLPSIYSQGLQIPGKDTGVRVANGSVLGVGIYTAKGHSASTSFGYTRGASKPMLVCAALDDDELVKHTPSVMVFFDDARVVPLFEATATVRAKPVARVAPAAVPRVGPRTRLQRPQDPLVAFLSRRAACKRRG